jgi:hypothetical protein
MRIDIRESRSLNRGGIDANVTIQLNPMDVDVRYRYVPDDVLISFHQGGLDVTIYLEREEWEKITEAVKTARPRLLR